MLQQHDAALRALGEQLAGLLGEDASTLRAKLAAAPALGSSGSHGGMANGVAPGASEASPEFTQRRGPLLMGHTVRV